MKLVYAAFFLSGFPALIYQLVWQRSLFTIYGINIESITVVVTAFMMGLGLGSLLGGAVSKWKGTNPLLAFAVFEFSIGLFGVASPGIFEIVGAHTLGASAFETFVITFSLVLFPTLLMGATLPLLVVHLVRQFRNVGVSVGVLYFVNTLGAAVVCFIVVVWLFGSFGKTGTLYIASGLNFLVGGAALLAHWLNPGGSPQLIPSGRAKYSSGASDEALSQPAMGTPLALFVVGVIGYISLSYEILWVRVFSFLLAGNAAAFPLLLGAFLTGIAFGSWFARRYCRNIVDISDRSHLRALAYFVLFATAIGFFIAPGMSFASSFTALAFALALCMVVIGAALFGATLPLVSHLAIRPDEGAGSSLSFLYLSNIVGSAAGSLITGFVLMDHWRLEQIGVFVALVGLVLGVLLLWVSRTKSGSMVGAASMAGVTAGLVFFSAPALFDQSYERLLYKLKFSPEKRFAEIVETKSGVITVTQEGIVFGGGIYDGHFNVSLLRDTNLIVRAYFLGAIHPAPRKVLMIGLASGSWAQVIANHPSVENLTVVEINPGYASLVARHEEVVSLLSNPKVQLVVDDGRRWLARNPDRKFDAIIMNTSFVWRAHATNLFSKEFLGLVKAHLEVGGLVYYNTGNNPNVQRTAAESFRHVLRVYNFIAASDAQIKVDSDRWEKVLYSYSIDGLPVFPVFPDEETRAKVASVLARAKDFGIPMPDQDPNSCCFLEGRSSILTRTGGRDLVTDDNMITEWPQILSGGITLARIWDRLGGKAVGL